MKKSSTAVQTATKSMPANTSQAVIGSKLTANSLVTVNYRQGKSNTVACAEVECIDMNATGRRLTLIFRDEAGNEIMKRRVYKEHFEVMERKFANVAIPTTPVIAGASAADEE
jgi:hypothetical protein